MVEGMTRTADRPRARARPAAAAPRRVRIVGGRWKRTLLPVVDLPDLRPTPDRVRETLYNWLGQDLDGQRVLDLFAGTGALGFEAASRGAREVTLVENHPRASRHLEATRERLAAGQVRVVHGDADRWLDGALAAGLRFELILLDPPFGQDRIAALLPRLRDLLAPSGRVYVELPSPLATMIDEVTLSDWQILRAGRAGVVHYHLLVAAAPVAASVPATAGAGDPGRADDADVAT